MRFEEFCGGVNGHIQDIGDVFILEADLQGLAVITAAVADITRDIDIRQELHLDHELSLPGACLASSPFDIEGEAPFLIAAHLALG